MQHRTVVIGIGTGLYTPTRTLRTRTRATPGEAAAPLGGHPPSHLTAPSNARTTGNTLIHQPRRGMCVAVSLLARREWQ